MYNRAPDKARIFNSIMSISSPNPVLQDDSHMWSNIGFGEETMQVDSLEFIFTHLIWRSGTMLWTVKIFL